MKPLLTDRASTFERRILDVETTGLGTAVEARSSDARPPRALITVVRYPDGQKIRWWGERSIQHAIEQCVEETADGTDVEVLGHFAGSFDFRLELRWFLLRWPCRWRFTKVSSLPLSIEGRPLSSRQADDESDEDDDGRAGRFRLVDTYRILPGKLDDIGKAVGLHKGSWDHGFHSHRDYAGGPTKGKRVGYRFHAPICYEALAKYCELDCDVLDAGVDKIDKFAEDRGVHRRLTIASTSTASIRKGLTKETVATAPPEVREISKLACFGGRVEVFRNECGPARVYDIQSSYPWAMTQGLAWRFERSRPRWDGEEDAIVEAVIEVPDDCYVPVMPMRAIRPEEAGRVYFPTGIFRTVAYGAELAYAVANKFAKVIDVAICHLFSRSMIMGDFAKEVWEERRVASGFYKYALKIWLNSAYGKLNEQEERDEIVVRPQSFICERHRTQAREPGERCGCMEELSRELGLYGYKFRREPSFHAPWAAAGVLGRARVNLHKFFMQALGLGGKLYYTDSVTADRTTVLRRPDGRTCVESFEQLWARAHDVVVGDKEVGELAGWKALARDADGREGWFDVRSIIRHRVSKSAFRISAKDGQTEVTEDHGIMRGAEAVTPEEFVQTGAKWEKVRATKPLPGRVDLLDYLREFSHEGRRFVVSDDRGWLVLAGQGPRHLLARVRRFYDPGTESFGALLRAVGAFVAEGSASITGLTTCRMMFTISQKDRSWLEAVADDLRMNVEGVEMSLLETSGVWSLRSGASFLPFLFAALCGVGDGSKTRTGSQSRKLPEFCYDLSTSDFDVLWAKLVEGDGRRQKTIRRTSTATKRRPPTCRSCGVVGHRSPSCGKTHTGQVSYTTTSQQLAAGLSYALDQHDVEYAINFRPSKGSWTIVTRPAGSERKRRLVTTAVRKLENEWVYDLCVEGAHTFVDGIGRVLLHNTDCLPTDVEMPTDKGTLGALSSERRISSAKFVAPKLYGMICEECDAKDDDGAPAKHPHEVVRAKGFSRMKMADLDALTHCPRCQASGFRPGTAFGCPRCEGGSLGRPGTGRAPYSYERSEGLGEALRRRQNVDYRRLVVTRALRQTRPKRADGGARPWTVEELAERWVA